MDRPSAALAAVTALVAAVLLRLKRRQTGPPSTAKAAQAAGAATSGDDAQAPAGCEVEDSAADLSAAQKATGSARPEAQQTAQPEEPGGSIDAALAAARAPLFRAAPNELLVHGWLLQGQEGDAIPSLPPLDADEQAPGRLATGRRHGSLGPAPVRDAATGQGLGAQPAGAELRRAVAEIAERAFFDALADGLRRGESGRLAALLLDARDQLAALLPGAGAGDGARDAAGGGDGPPAGTEGEQLLAELREKLDTEYVRQRLRRYDPQYCSQAFDLLLHVIARLQAPARRAATQEQYATVAAAFAAAALAEAQAQQAPQAAGESLRSQQGGEGWSRREAGEPPQEAEHVRVQLSLAEGGAAVRVRLSVAPPQPPAEQQLGGLEWRLVLEPGPTSEGGAVIARLVPRLGSGDSSAPAAAPGAAGGAAHEDASSGEAEGEGPAVGSAPGEASVAALVDAARFLLRQLEELRADVARARLALLKRSVLGADAGPDYERARFQRALHSVRAALGERGGGGDGDVAAAAFPATLSWLRQVLQEAPPPLGLEGAAACRACLCAGLLLLVQRPQAVPAEECPEPMLLDLGAIVAAQNELQRLCLLASSCLIVQQVLASLGALPPPGSPARRQLGERVVGRVGALLGGEVGLEGIALELHGCVEAALQLQRAPEADAGADAAQRAQQQPAAQQAQQKGGGTLELVRGMVSRTFSTDDPVYRRVQAGLAAALAALLRGAERRGSDAPADGSPAGWRQSLRGVGAEALAGDVHRLAAGLYRLAAVSTAVAQPVVYDPLLRLLRQGQAAG